jgi:hypothetical protein
MKTNRDSNIPELGLVLAPPREVSFSPLKSRGAPVVWVKKLSVWSQWPPSDATKMRVVELHRGLNILRAETKRDAKAPRISGHAAGKTTFCRFLRFILDEKQYGTEEFRQDFRNLHGDGWVIAEVYIDNKPWLVGKTLGDRGRHHFAIPGADLNYPFQEQPPSGGYSDYQKALEDAVLGKLKIRDLSGSGKSLKWVHLLAWLARDQESHYANLLAWRDAASQTEGQDLAYGDRENLIRLVMGLVEDTEQIRLRERAKAATNHEDKLKERGPLEFIRNRARTALETALGKSVDEILGGKRPSTENDKEANAAEDPILKNEIENRAKALEAQAEDAIKAAGFDEEEKEVDNRVAAALARVNAELALYNRIYRSLQELEGAPIDKTGDPKPDTSNSEINDRLVEVEKAIGKLRNLCNRTRDEAKKLGCPHFLAPEPDVQTDIAISKQEERDDAMEQEKRREIEKHKLLLQELQTSLDAAKSAEREARDYKKKIGEFLAAERKRLGEPAVRAQTLKDAFTTYKKACGECNDLSKTLNDLVGQKELLDKEISELARIHREVITDFGLVFDALAKELLGDQVTGTIELGKGIQPDLIYRGRRKSAALNLANLLAFDLACLALGMTSEQSHHPRFLIHDSPRESDLDIGIYHALFKAACRLEMACDGEPAFQYIVTTTEAPPDDFNKPQWVLDPVLDASIPEKRFLGRDL